jgi:hypothetical protein
LIIGHFFFDHFFLRSLLLAVEEDDRTTPEFRDEWQDQCRAAGSPTRRDQMRLRAGAVGTRRRRKSGGAILIIAAL